MKIDIRPDFKLTTEQRELIRRLLGNAGQIMVMESSSGIRYEIVITMIKVVHGKVGVDMYYRSQSYFNGRQWDHLGSWSGLRQLPDRSGYIIQGVNDED